MKIKKSAFLTFFLALTANTNFITLLPAEKVSIDFGGNEILACDLVAYVDFFNGYYVSRLGSDDLMPNVPEKTKKLKEWYEKAEKPDLRNMPPEHFANVFEKIFKRISEDKEKFERYKDETVETTLQTELMSEKFTESVLKTINDAITASEKRGCVHTCEGNEDEGSLTFVLKNGKISERESPQLFEKLNIPFKLVFENVTGSLVASDAVKRQATSIVFRNCRLNLQEDCFRGSERLKELEFFQSDILLANGAFAECSHFEAVNAEKTNLVCLPPDSYSEVFKGTLKEKSIMELTVRTFCHLLDGSCEMGKLAEFVQCNRIDASALKRYYKIIFKKEIQDKTEESRKIFEGEIFDREKRCEAIEKENRKLKKENEHQKGANENLRADMEVLVQKNKKLQSSLEDSSKICEDRLNEFLKLENTYKNSEKEHAEAIEKFTKELEKIRSNFVSSNEKLEKYKTSFSDARQQLDALERKNEDQKEEIERLKAFKSKWEAKILTFERLEIENNEFSKQLNTAKGNEDNSKRMLKQERAQNKEDLKKKNVEILHLRQELKEAKNLLFNAQAKIKELQNSEAHILTTVGGALADDEDEKEEEKNNAFRPSKPVIKKNFKSNRSKKSTGWKNFEYPKNDTQ